MGGFIQNNKIYIRSLSSLKKQYPNYTDEKYKSLLKHELCHLFYGYFIQGGVILSQKYLYEPTGFSRGSLCTYPAAVVITKTLQS